MDKKFPCSLEKLNSQGNDFVQIFTEPSMVEPCYNPSIIDMLMHPELAFVRNGQFDEGDSLEDVSDSWNDDIQDIYEGSSEGRPSPKPDEFGKPSDDDEDEHSESEESEPDPGT